MSRLTQTAASGSFLGLVVLGAQLAFAQPNIQTPVLLMSTSDAPKSESRFVGRWTWTLDIGPQPGKVTIDVKQDGKRLTAVLITPDGEKVKPKEFIVKENKVTIRIERKRGLFTFKLTHEGELKGDSIRGEFTASGGPLKKQGNWQASRVNKK